MALQQSVTPVFTTNVTRQNGFLPRRRACSNGDSGYALLLVMFLLALVVLAGVAAAPNVFTQGRREKEEEMIWRGKQYERAIKLYYRKNNRLPGSLDDLTTPNQLGLRYLRRAYKDPMNQNDGSWRMIYLGPGGQLIGSTRPSVVFTIGAPGGIAPPALTSATSSTQQGGGNLIGQQLNTATSLGSPAAGDSFEMRNGATSFSAGSFGGPNQGGSDSTDTMTASSPASGQDSSSSQIFGGRIIGVGSKVDMRSVRWLNGAKNYLQFEFIWDPSKEGLGVNPALLYGQQNNGSSNQQPLAPTVGQSNGLNSFPSGPPLVQSNPE